MRRLLLVPAGFLLIFSSLAVAQIQTERNLQALEELEASREILDTLEAEFGRDAMALIEPMERLADQLMALNQFDDADRLLDRAVQITRYHNGLHTPAQLSLIRKRIENFTVRQDWDDARDQMEYLFTYYLRVPVALNANLIEDLIELADQHLLGVTEDEIEEQGFHFNRAHQLNLAMITAARELHGDNSPMLVPLLYRQAKHYYMFRKIFDNNMTRNTAFRDSLQSFSRRGYGARHMPRKELKRIYYLEGRHLLEQIRDIYSQTEPLNQIGLAMSELYLADWDNLFDFSDVAAEGYVRGYAMLTEAGEAEERVNALFGQPRILPMQEFYTTIDDALAELPATDDSSSYQLMLTEWTAAIPTVSSPLDSFDREDDDSDVALMSMQLPPENKVSFLYSNRFPTSIGRASEVEPISGFTSIDRGSRKALERLEHLRFRPKMVDGEVVESSSIVRFEIASAN